MDRTVKNRISAIALGGLLLAMAAGQLSNLAGFMRILAAYELGAALSTLLAWGLVVAEGVGGLGLVYSGVKSPAPRPRVFFSVIAIVVAGIWSALALQAYVRGLSIANCGCFGVHLAQRLSGWILLQDASFLAWTVFVWRGALGGKGAAPRPAGTFR